MFPCFTINCCCIVESQTKIWPIQKTPKTFCGNGTNGFQTFWISPGWTWKVARLSWIIQCICKSSFCILSFAKYFHRYVKIYVNRAWTWFHVSPFALSVKDNFPFFSEFFFHFFFQSQPQMILQQPLVSGVAQVEVWSLPLVVVRRRPQQTQLRQLL